MCIEDGLKCKDCPDYARPRIRRDKLKFWRSALLRLQREEGLSEEGFFAALEWFEDLDTLDSLPAVPPADLSAVLVQKLVDLRERWRVEDAVV